MPAKSAGMTSHLTLGGESLHRDLHLFAWLEPVVRAQSVEHAEALDRMVGRRHAVREFFHRVGLTDRNHPEAKRLDLFAFLQRHAAERHDRLAKGAIDLRRPCLCGKDETIDFAAKTHSEQTERPVSATRRCARRREAIERKLLDA